MPNRTPEDDFELEKWVMEYDLEETRNDPHYSIYYTPEYEEEECS
jgi:hypothetical protein